MYGTVCRIGYAAFVLLTASAGLAQTRGSLPDAPSAVLVRERLSDPTSQVSAQVFREERAREFLPGSERKLQFQADSLTPRNDAEKLSAIGHKLVPALPMQSHFRYEPSDSPGMLGRTTHAISRVLLARDGDGRSQANAAYLFGAIVTSVLSTAYQPYVRHDPTEVLGNFGSTVGGAAGINLFHEFWPQLKQRLSSRVPHALQRSPAVFKNR